MTDFTVADPTSLTDQELCRLIGELEPTETGEDNAIGAALLHEAERRGLDL
jgi:hypothetical protein